MYGALFFVATDVNNEDWNHPLYWSLPSKYRFWDYKLEDDDYKIIRNSLEENKDFKAFLHDTAKSERKKILAYFEPIVRDKKFAFVELSGTGLTQNCICKTLAEITKETLCTYFLNLDGMECGDNVQFINYLPNGFWYSWIIENLCRAPHGQTNGYRCEGSTIVPVFSDYGEKEALIEHGYLNYLLGVAAFSYSFATLYKTDESCFESPLLFQKYLKHITYNPAPEIKNFIGDMPFEATGFRNSVSTYAPILSEKQMRDIFLTRRDDESIDKFYDGADLDFSLKRMKKEDIDKINFYKSAVATKYGRNARIRRRFEEDGLLNASVFYSRRFVREVLIKLRIIKY